jgi:hypothetical protein
MKTALLALEIALAALPLGVTAAQAEPRQCAYYYTMQYFADDSIPLDTDALVALLYAKCGGTKGKEALATGVHQALRDAARLSGNAVRSGGL